MYKTQLKRIIKVQEAIARNYEKLETQTLTLNLQERSRKPRGHVI